MKRLKPTVLTKACSSGKVIHSSEGAALESIVKCAEHGAPKLRAYRCMECMGWHLTKIERKVK